MSSEGNRCRHRLSQFEGHSSTRFQSTAEKTEETRDYFNNQQWLIVGTWAGSGGEDRSTPGRNQPG